MLTSVCISAEIPYLPSLEIKICLWTQVYLLLVRVAMSSGWGQTGWWFLVAITQQSTQFFTHLVRKSSRSSKKDYSRSSEKDSIFSRKNNFNRF